MSETKKDKLVSSVLREMKFFAILSLTFNFNIKFQYIITCMPSKIPRGGGRGVREGLGMDKIMGFSISPDLMFSITFVSVIHFHNHLCISTSPKILKEIFAHFSFSPKTLFDSPYWGSEKTNPPIIWQKMKIILEGFLIE